MKHKFRAWDKENKCMVYQEDMNGQMINKPYWFSLSECEVELLKFDEEYKAYCRINADIMQYTGLKDKKGIEIYEGDIVEFIHSGEKHTSEIYYKELEGFHFKFNYEDYVYDFSISDLKFPHRNVKIIGNIYEDSELLGGNR